MDLEQQLVEAMKQELQRQADDGALRLRDADDDRVHLEGDVDLGALAMAVAGAVAGGP